jgi:predicted nucleic acid-binding Zn ribbon protein
MTATEPDPLPLPGLEDGVDSRRAVTDLESAVRRTIAAHQELDHLTEVDAGKCAIAIELCQVAARKRAGGRMSTISNDLRLLQEILDSLTPDADTDVDAKLRAAMAEWSEEVSNAADASAEVRDTP